MEISDYVLEVFSQAFSEVREGLGYNAIMGLYLVGSSVMSWREWRKKAPRPPGLDFLVIELKNLAKAGALFLSLVGLVAIFVSPYQLVSQARVDAYEALQAQTDVLRQVESEGPHIAIKDMRVQRGLPSSKLQFVFDTRNVGKRAAAELRVFAVFFDPLTLKAEVSAEVSSANEVSQDGTFSFFFESSVVAGTPKRIIYMRLSYIGAQFPPMKTQDFCFAWPGFVDKGHYAMAILHCTQEEKARFLIPFDSAYQDGHGRIKAKGEE